MNNIFDNEEITRKLKELEDLKIKVEKLLSLSEIGVVPRGYHQRIWPTRQSRLRWQCILRGTAWHVRSSPGGYHSSKPPHQATPQSRVLPK